MGSSPIPQQGTTIPTPGQPGPLQPGEWQPSASPTVVNFRRQHLDASNYQYVQTGDQLVCSACTIPGNSDTVTFIIRLLLPDPPHPGQPDGTGAPAQPGGTPTAAQIAAAGIAGAGAAQPMLPAVPAVVQQLITTVSVVGSSTATVRLPLQEGFLLSVAALGGTSLGRGILFARCYLQQRAGLGNALAPAMVLFSDYTDVHHPIGWPGGRAVYPTEGTGYENELSVGNPSAGSDWFYQVPTSMRMRLSSWSAVLTTSATAGNRYAQAMIRNAANAIVWLALPSQAIAASLTAQVSAAPGQYTSVGVSTTVTVSLPSPCIILAQETFGTVTSGIQAGDQWSNIKIVGETWLDDI